jgi:signal transduction histidine kinase
MRTRTTWLLFAVAVAVVLGVMAAVTGAVLDLDARRIQSERQAIVEELVRLSLWRMDSATTLLLSREIAEAGEAPTADLPSGVRARFVVDVTDTRILATADASTDDRLRRLVAAHAVGLESLPIEAAEQNGIVIAQVDVPEQELRQQAANPGPEQLPSQELRNQAEYYKRVASVNDNVNAYTSTWRSSKGSSKVSGSNGSYGLGGMEAPDVEEPENSDGKGEDRADSTLLPSSAEREMMRPMWWGDELVLVRRVVDGGQVRLEGSWIDWPVLQSLLLHEIEDLWPSATLVAADADSLDDADRRLATLPVRLQVTLDAVTLPVEASPLRLSLAVGWMFVLLATSAVVVLLRASLALSERRAAFVSAVTHELRTPLTTFRMYTEMLGEGLVEEKGERYVATLRREAERLGHLVENVLSYARIESDRVVRSRERIGVTELVDRLADRLNERTRAGDVQLDLDVEDEAAAATVSVDPPAIEQILFNLVDNATKYGATEADPRVRVAIERIGGEIAIHVRDHGPGIPVDERRGIFAPFAKGRAHAAGTKPGVGLGLALSLRLAREMGGRLQLVPSDRGADFVLTLPVV